MKKKALKQNRQVFVMILSSIMLFVAIGLSVSYAWITGAFEKSTSSVNNPITYIAISDTQGAITGTLDLNQTSISKAISFTNNSDFDVEIENVLITVTFYESEAAYNASEPNFDIDPATSYITPTLASGWSTTDNCTYTTTSATITKGTSKAFITGFTLSNINADKTFYEITFIIITSPIGE